MKISELLDYTLTKGAFDLHLVTGVPPVIRVIGNLTPVVGRDVLTAEKVKELVFSLLEDEQKEILTVNKELDFAFDWSSWLQTGENISTYVLTPSAGISVSTHSESSGVVTAWLSTCAADSEFEVHCKITTDTTPARVDERSMRIHSVHR